jgi:hypothetical protein
MENKNLTKIIELLEQQKQTDGGVWDIGKKYFIRSVEMYLTGELVRVTEKELLLKDAAWIADSGRFHKALKNINNSRRLNHSKKPVIVGRGAIIDATEIDEIIRDAK